jgi:hypothetical protein
MGCVTMGEKHEIRGPGESTVNLSRRKGAQLMQAALVRPRTARTVHCAEPAYSCTTSST